MACDDAIFAWNTVWSQSLAASMHVTFRAARRNSGPPVALASSLPEMLSEWSGERTRAFTVAFVSKKAFARNVTLCVVQKRLASMPELRRAGKGTESPWIYPVVFQNSACDFFPRNSKCRSGNACSVWYHAKTLPCGKSSARLADDAEFDGVGFVAGSVVAGADSALVQSVACAVNLENGSTAIPRFATLDVSSAAANLNFPRE